eukprot:s167_g13.t1
MTIHSLQENKLIRLASYRQLQAMSQQLRFLTNGQMKNLDSFAVPDGITLKPLMSGWDRFLRQEAGRNRAGFRNSNDGSEILLLPDDRQWWVDVPLLVLQLDQGPTCCGGAALLGSMILLWWCLLLRFLLHLPGPWHVKNLDLVWPALKPRFAIGKMESMILARWDVIHRSIRDVKLSLIHGAGGEFYQAQFHSQYLFSLAYRPYGSSGFFEDKKRLLELMMAREGPDTVPMFVDSWEKIRDEIGLPSTATMTDTWNALPNLDGFRTKQTLPKPSRWFAWNQAVEEKLPEWTALKCVLAYHFDGNEGLDPDDAYEKRQLDAMAKESAQATEKKSMRQEFGKLKEKLGGGLKLCFHIMSNKLLQMVKIIALCTRPVWSWYSHSIKEVLNAEHQVQKLIALQRNWVKERHLQRLAALPMSVSEELVHLLDNYSSSFDDTGPKVLELSQRLLKHRCWSLSKASAPPDCYAGLLSSDPIEQKAAASLLRADHRNLLELESLVANTGQRPPKILQDINVVCTPAIRLLFLSFEEGSYHHQTPGGLHLLRGMLQTLPDSKIVEDVHGTLRKESKKAPNKRQTAQALQELVCNSPVLATRRIQHKAFVTREVFLQYFPRTKETKRARLDG